MCRLAATALAAHVSFLERLLYVGDSLALYCSARCCALQNRMPQCNVKAITKDREKQGLESRRSVVEEYPFDNRVACNLAKEKSCA
jgi:hypothetical protein